MTPEMTTFIMFGSLIALLAIGVPLSWVLSVIAIAMTIISWNLSALFLFVTSIFGTMWNVMFIALPLFIGMGVMLEQSGLAEDMFDSMYKWIGRIRGGLAMGTVVICTIFAAMCGVAGAACVAMGMIALPAMRKRGYSRELALGTIAAPATLGILIPPSVVMVFLGVIGEISVGRLFLAGVMPGLMMALIFCIYISIIGKLSPHSCPASDDKFTFIQKVASLKKIILPLLIIAGVLGSIFTGAATPTEAAAIGFFTVLVAVIINGRFNWKFIREATTNTFKIVGMAVWIIFGSIAFSGVFSALGGTNFIKDALLAINLAPYFVLILMLLVVIALGMFIDPGGIIWIVCPIAYPIMRAMNFDLIWFSILLVICIMLGYITPPFGFNLFYLKSIVPPDVSMVDIYKAVTPYILLMILCVIILMIFPGIVTFLPNLMIKQG